MATERDANEQKVNFGTSERTKMESQEGMSSSRTSQERPDDSATQIPAQRGAGKEQSRGENPPSDEGDEEGDDPQPTATFPQRLMKVLDTPNSEYKDVISWLPHGKGFIIYNKKRFEAEVLPEHFKKSKFTSFTRKLNRWNFRRVPRGNEAGAYYHDQFQRGNVRLCMQMVCKNERPRYADAFLLHSTPLTLPQGLLSQHVLAAQQQQQQQQASAFLAGGNLSSQLSQLGDQDTLLGRLRQLEQFQQQQQNLSALASLGASTNQQLLAAQLALLGSSAPTSLGSAGLGGFSFPQGTNPSLLSSSNTILEAGIQMLQRDSNQLIDTYNAMLMAQEKVNPPAPASASAPKETGDSSDIKAMEDSLRATAQQAQIGLLQQAAMQRQSLDLPVPASPAAGQSERDSSASQGMADERGAGGNNRNKNIKRASAA